MKVVWRFLALLIFAILLGATLGTLVPRPLRPGAAMGTKSHHIMVLKNEIHTDLVIAIDDTVRQRFAFLSRAGLSLSTPHVSHVVFGWGGRAFYLQTPRWSDARPGPLLKAVTLDAAVMHVSLATAVPEPHPDVASFDIDEAHFADLLDFVAASFRQDGDGPLVISTPGYSRFDRFFEANGNFNVFVGCNTWTAEGLRAAGLRTGWWNPLPASLWMSLKLYN